MVDGSVVHPTQGWPLSILAADLATTSCTADRKVLQTSLCAFCLPSGAFSWCLLVALQVEADPFSVSLSVHLCVYPSVSNWWAINTLYYGGRLANGVPTGGAVSSSIALRGELSVPANADWGVIYDPYYGEEVLRSIPAVVTKSIKTARWPISTDAVYVVYSDSSVTQVRTADCESAMQAGASL